MRHRQLRLTLFDLGQAGQAHLPAVGGFDMDLVQRLRADFLAVLRLQGHAVLAGLGVDGGNLPLTEGVVQRIGDVATDTPRREAASRSITRYTCKPLSCRSLATSVSSGWLDNAVTGFWLQVLSKSASGDDRLN